MGEHSYLREHNEDWDRADERDWREASERNRSFMFGRRRKLAPHHFGSSQDEHYLNWRDRQMAALDQDYAEYCREREQQFNEDFDAWRRRRRTNPEPLQTGMIQTAETGDISGTLELSSKEAIAPQPGPDPVDRAMLGTTSTGPRR